MNGLHQVKTQPRRGAVFGNAARCDGVGRVQVVNRAPNQAAAGYRHAAKCRQRQQRSTPSLVAVSVGGSRLDIQEHHQACPRHAAGTWLDLLHQTGRLPQKHQLVCRDMGTAASPPRHGLRPAVLAPRRVRAMAGRNYTALPQNRTYEQRHRPQNRTRGRNHRPQKRTYGGRNGNFLGPKTVHLLDMPSVVQRKQSPLHRRAQGLYMLSGIPAGGQKPDATSYTVNNAVRALANKETM